MPYTTVRAATVRAESLKMMSPFTPTPSLADPQEFTDPVAPTPAGAIHAAEGLCDVGARVLDESDTLVLEHAWPGPKTVNYYVIHVNKGTTSHTVRRRYKDFDALNVALGDTYGKHMVPPNFPGKQLVKNESAEFVEQRRHELRRWLAAVTEDRYLSLSPEVCAFLECEAATQLAARSALSRRGALAAELGGGHRRRAPRSTRPRCSSRCSARRRPPPRTAAPTPPTPPPPRRARRSRSPRSAPTGGSQAFRRLRRGARRLRRRRRRRRRRARRCRRGRARRRAETARRRDARDGGAAGGEGARRACRRLRSRSWATSTPLPRRPVRGAGGAAAVDGGAAAHAAAQAAAGGERVVKAMRF